MIHKVSLPCMFLIARNDSLDLSLLQKEAGESSIFFASEHDNVAIRCCTMKAIWRVLSQDFRGFSRSFYFRIRSLVPSGVLDDPS